MRFPDRLKHRSLLALISAAISLILISSFIPSLRKPLLSVVKVPLKLLTLVKDEFEGLICYHRNYIRNARLEKEVDYLKFKLNEQQESVLENERLRSLLSLKENSAFRVISSRVIGRSPDSWSSSLIIDKGKQQGVRTGLAVITYLGLAGRVVEAGANTSKILLVNDPNISVSGIIQRSRQEGLVTGTLGPNLLMKYLPQDADVKPGDEVVTSGLNSGYPKGLIIGEVVEVGSEFSGLSLYAIVRPALKLSNVEEVLIVTSW